MRALWRLGRVEVLLFLREPLSVAFVLVLPALVLVVLNGVFGNSPNPSVYDGVGPVDFYTPTYVALVLATTGILGLSVQLAGYRERGVLRRFRASALPVGAVVGSQVVVALVAGVAGTAVLVPLSVIGFDAALPAAPGAVAAGFVLVLLAFAALGVLLGVVIPTARGAQGVGAVVFFLFLILGGAGPPREVLPTGMQRISDLVPLTYAGRTLREPWLGNGWDLSASLVVAAVLVVSAGLAAWRLRWD